MGLYLRHIHLPCVSPVVKQIVFYLRHTFTYVSPAINNGSLFVTHIFIMCLLQLKMGFYL